MAAYKTIKHAVREVLFKDQRSKFHGYAFPIVSEKEVKSLLENVREEHPAANHICFAWRLGVKPVRYRMNDDGEPKNSAGAPIYGQIQSFGITNVLIVVARIYGGKKLGVGGLINAYRSTARLALEVSEIVEKTIVHSFSLSFDYPLLGAVMRIIKHNKWEIRSLEQGSFCKLTILVPENEKENALAVLNAMHEIDIR